MSAYKFKADAIINVDASASGRFINVELDLTTPQAKHAFLLLAGDTRGNELGEWMAELGYEIKEIETVDCHV
jgi:hypothetical protein